jgi:hypothetical protein
MNLATQLGEILERWINHKRQQAKLQAQLIQLRDDLLARRDLSESEVPPKKHRLLDYQYSESLTYHAIAAQCGKDLKVIDLLSIAEQFANRQQPPLHIGRDVKRRKDLLYQWFESHYEAFIQFLPNVTIFVGNS